MARERQQLLIALLHDRLDRLAIIVARDQKESLDDLLFLEKSAFLELSRELESEVEIDAQLVSQLSEILNKIEHLSLLVTKAVVDLEKKLLVTSDKLKKIRRYASSRETQNLLLKSV